jgi:hypothetical protein
MFGGAHEGSKQLRLQEPEEREPALDGEMPYEVQKISLFGSYS